MTTAYLDHQSYPILAEAIKVVGVGKKGSQPMDADLIARLKKELPAIPAEHPALGAFLGAILMKGLTEEERALKEVFKVPIFDDAMVLVDYLAASAPELIKELCVKLVKHESLTRDEAYGLGQFLFSHQLSDSLRGLAASILRVRYETPDEYEGLLKSIQAHLAPPFKSTKQTNSSLIQISEPFDGVDHSLMTTPLLGRYLQQQGNQVVHMVGRNSGPKVGINLYDIAVYIKEAFLKDPAQLQQNAPAYGWFLDQKDLCPALDRWVDLRKQTVKRPFLATLERFINGVNADVIIGSAFHPPYGEKMLTVCERNQFPGIIIVRNGIEGTIAFPLMRPVKILCSRKNKAGEYERNEFLFDAAQELHLTIDREERIDYPSVEQNAQLIAEYTRTGHTSNELFNHRVAVTQLGIGRALQWVREYEK